MDLTATQQLSATQILAIRPAGRVTRQSRLQSIAEYLPFTYVAAGFSAFFATLYVPEWYWVLPYYFLIGCGGVHTILHFAAAARKTAKESTSDAV